jgi:hypothetical protein
MTAGFGDLEQGTQGLGGRERAESQECVMVMRLYCRESVWLELLLPVLGRSRCRHLTRTCLGSCLLCNVTINTILNRHIQRETHVWEAYRWKFDLEEFCKKKKTVKSIIYTKLISSRECKEPR